MPENVADFQPTGWPVYGHTWAVQFLQRTLQTAAGGLRHAYLFLGPPQVGKSTLARAFVQALFCEKSSEQPCGECRACRAFATWQPSRFSRRPADRQTIERIGLSIG